MKSFISKFVFTILALLGLELREQTFAADQLQVLGKGYMAFKFQDVLVYMRKAKLETDAQGRLRSFEHGFALQGYRVKDDGNISGQLSDINLASLFLSPK